MSTTRVTLRVPALHLAEIAKQIATGQANVFNLSDWINRAIVRDLNHADRSARRTERFTFTPGDNRAGRPAKKLSHNFDDSAFSQIEPTNDIIDTQKAQ